MCFLWSRFRVSGSLVVFREALKVADVPDGFKNIQDGGKEVLRDRFFEPFGPFADIIRIS